MYKKENLIQLRNRASISKPEGFFIMTLLILKNPFVMPKTELSAVKVKLVKEGWKKEIEFPYHKNLTLKEIREVINPVKKEYIQVQKEREKEKQRMIETAQTDPLCGNLLACAIAEMMEKNKNELVTMLRIIAAMRGTAFKGEFNFTSSEMSGKFSLLTEDQIRWIVIKMVKSDVLGERMVDGKYNTYYKYLKGVNSALYDLLLQKEHFLYTEDGKKSKKYDTFTDLDWLCFIEQFDASELSLKEWQKILPVLEHENLPCAYPEKVGAFFKSAPDNIKYYIQTLVEVEEGKRKKQLKKVQEYLK